MCLPSVSHGAHSPHPSLCLRLAQTWCDEEKMVKDINTDTIFTTDTPLAALLEGAAGTESEGVTEGSYFIADYTFSYTHFVIFLLLLLLTYLVYFLFSPCWSCGVLFLLPCRGTQDGHARAQLLITFLFSCNHVPLLVQDYQAFPLPSERGNAGPRAPAGFRHSAARNRREADILGCGFMAENLPKRVICRISVTGLSGSSGRWPSTMFGVDATARLGESRRRWAISSPVHCLWRVPGSVERISVSFT